MRNYLIAGLVFGIDGAQDMPHLLSRMSAYEIPSASECDIHITCEITEDDLTLPDNITEYKAGMFTYIEYDTPCGRRFGYYGGPDGSRVTNLITSDKDFTDISIRLTHMDFDIDDPDGRRAFNSIGNIVEIGMPLHNRMVFHSSSIAYKGVGICFSAASGTGKSTHTGLWQEVFPGEVTLVNDDKPILLFENGATTLCGTPWAGTTGINANVNVPLKAVFILTRGETCSAEPVNEIFAIQNIIKESPKPVIPYITDKYLEAVSNLVSSVPIFRLRCDISHDAVATSYNCVFK